MCTFEGKQIRNNLSKGMVNYHVERDVGRDACVLLREKGCGKG